MASADNNNFIVCSDCGKKLKSDNYYLDKRGNRTEQCKKCLTRGIRNEDPSTFLPILEKLDFPYIEQLWRKIIHKEKMKNPNNPAKWIGGKDVLGKYLIRMRMNQWENYWYKDSLKATKYYEQTNTESFIYDKDGSVISNKGNSEVEEKNNEEEIQLDFPVENEFQTFQSLTPTQKQNRLMSELTEDDITRMTIKWGGSYRDDQWIQLEAFYNDMCHSFAIENASRENMLKYLCKINLKMNDALDAGDVQTFEKLSKVYDTFMKSGKFTEAQNKDGNSQTINSAAELVAMCEKDGFIPRFCTDTPQDKVDATIQNMQEYVHNLIINDMGFGAQFEAILNRFVQDAEEEKEKKEDKQKEDKQKEEPVQLPDDDDVGNFFDNIEEDEEEITDDSIPDIGDVDFYGGDD